MTLLGEQELVQRLEGSPWRREGGAIAREWRFEDFAGAMAFANRVADAAEAANHHPDIRVHSWNRVALTLATHSEGGVTDKDLALASTIDGLS